MSDDRDSWKKAMAIGPLVLAGIFLVARAGEMDPSGAPSPTVTAIDETDPRIPIRNGDLPLTISESGSYYLAEDVSTTGDGIEILADAVTIDLMGLSLSGGTGNGIGYSGAVEGLTVRNGTVSGWTLSGVQAPVNSLVIDVHAEGNGLAGIWAWNGSAVINSTATNNHYGIYASGASLNNCTAAFNNSTGIRVYQGSTVTGCAATFNDGDGIYVDGAIVRDSMAKGNFDNGIYVFANSSVVGNLCSLNSNAGIYVIGSDNRIEGNNVVGNLGPGFDVDGFDNIIIKNTARDNAQNYAQIAPGNAVGQVQAVSGNFTNTNAWANFSY